MAEDQEYTRGYLCGGNSHQFVKVMTLRDEINKREVEIEACEDCGVVRIRNLK